LSSIILVLLSPNIMNPLDGWIPVEPLFPLKNPGIVSIPLGFLGAFLGSWWSRASVDQDRYEKMAYQAHMGLPWEKEGQSSS
jgi:cation/acetate symporter